MELAAEPMARCDPRPAAAAPAAPRAGPRPLALHLAQALLAWGGCGAASAGCPAAPADDDRRRLAAFLRGLRVYREHPYRRDLPEPPVRWRRGTTRLLDYGGGESGGGGLPVLAVPSLVNRAYVLDLTRERSLLRHLAGLGLRPLLIDWGEPGREELGFTLTDYVVGRLEPALDAARRLAGGRSPVAVLGYCMGGLLALALAQRRSADMAGLALLATPWDFHADGMGGPGFLAAAGGPASQAVAALGRLPASLQHALFAGLDPLGAARRFGRLGAVAADGATARTFVALEDWANDGVPLAGPVAQECLLGWYGLNTPARGRWRVAGRRVRPEAVRLPAFVAVPEHDRIVPPASAAALAGRLPGAERHAVAAGHVSMVAGPKAPARLWAPLGAWLLRLAGAAMQK